MKHFKYNKKHLITLWHAFCKWQTQKHKIRIVNLKLKHIIMARRRLSIRVRKSWFAECGPKWTICHMICGLEHYVIGLVKYIM